MSKPSLFATAVALSVAVAFAPACKKRNDDKDSTAKTATAAPTPPPPPPPPPAPPKADVPFKGVYTKFAEATWKNGRRYPVTNANGTATLNVQPGVVTYSQTYTARGKKRTVIQVYTFTQDQVKPVANGGYDVAMMFSSMTGDTEGYSPDKNNPKLQARKQASGWEVGLTTTDNNGVMGGVEFR